MRVLVADSLADEGVKALQGGEGIEVDVITGLKEEQLVEIIPRYQALVVRSATTVTRRIIEEGHELKIIGRAGVGVDNIDVDAATERGIIVVNAPEGNTIAACEHTWAMMLALARSVPEANRLLKNGVWEKKKFMGVELRHKTLGILGLGKIGSEVAKRARAFEMNVISYDPYTTGEKAKKMGVELVSLDELLTEADFLTIHMPLTDETKHLLNGETLSKVKKGIRIINVARGGIIDEEALAESIQAGKVAGAAIDVFETEPTTASPLFALDNVVVTPHLGASTKEAQVNVALEVAAEILACLRGEPVKNAVNLPQIKPELREFLAPYAALVEKMGHFAAQLIGGGLHEVEINYQGELAEYDLTSLTNTFLKGLLRPSLADAVNFVNAQLVARNRGIKVAESKSSTMRDYTNLITVTLKTETESRSLAGTLFGNNQFRIVRLDGYSIDAIPEGRMLVIPHDDRPRTVGPVATLLGDHGINIAGMQLGRKVAGGRAVMVLNIDNEVPPEVLAEIKARDGIYDVKYVRM